MTNFVFCLLWKQAGISTMGASIHLKSLISFLDSRRERAFDLVNRRVIDYVTPPLSRVNTLLNNSSFPNSTESTARGRDVRCQSGPLAFQQWGTTLGLMFFFVLGLGATFTNSLMAEDPAERFIRENENRAAYWAARGFEFDPLTTSADSMDRQVENQRRSAYWAERGFIFDPRSMSAFAMDRRAEARLRAIYWRQWGIQFDGEQLDAATMDDAAAKLSAISQKLEALRKREGKVPALVIEQAADRILDQAPRVAGASKNPRPLNNAVPTSAVPIAMRGIGGAGIGQGLGGAGGRSGAGVRGVGAGNALINSRSRSNSTARRQIPDGVDPEQFFEQLSRAGIGF
ncbi:MAG: hypothetical protein AAFP69_14365 [Planctomycetota bacterium]